jgi:chaperonin cofactor prefoldin
MGAGKEIEEGCRKSISIKDIERTLKEITSEEDLKPYRNLGNGLYELSGCIITNKKGLKEYLKEFKRRITV